MTNFRESESNDSRRFTPGVSPLLLSFRPPTWNWCQDIEMDRFFSMLQNGTSCCKYRALVLSRVPRDSRLRGRRLFSSIVLTFFQYACRTVRPDFRRLPIGIYIDKHVFIVP